MSGSDQTLTSEMTAPPAGRDPDWLGELRRRGRAAREAAAMPTPALEDWRYAEIDFHLDDYAPAPPPSDPRPLPDDDYLAALPEERALLRIVDGHPTRIPEGEQDGGAVTGTPLTLSGRWGEEAARRYGTATPAHEDLFAAAHLAEGPPGAVIIIPPGRVVEAPVAVDVQSVAPGSVSFPHITVAAGADSEARVVVAYRSAPGADLLSAPVIEAFAGDGARLRVTVVQHMSPQARLVAHHRYAVGRDSHLKIGEVGLGGGYARQRMGIDLDGAGSSVEMGGIYFGDGSQILDYRMFITHRGPRTSSNIFLKGAVADSAQAIWTGLMRIENGAVGTSAFETNRNLVLSDGAKVHSVPNLEILTDDLQCGHGSSSGPLEEEPLYYLMSRGLGRHRAERLLVRGFFDEILSAMSEPGLAAPARRAVADKFAAAQGSAAGGG